MSRSCTGHARRGSAPPTSPASSARWPAAPQLIAQMDADFSHDPADLPRLLEAARSTPTWCSGRATSPAAGSPSGDRCGALISRGGSAYARTLLGVGIHDLTGGFKVFRRAVLEAIELETIPSLGYAFQVETTYRALRAGFRVVEVPIMFRDRRVGESKMSGAIVIEAALRVPAMRLRRRRS